MDGLFGLALRDIGRHGRSLPAILALPALLQLGVEFFTWNGLTWLGIAITPFMVALLAVRWHRLVLIGAEPVMLFADDGRLYLKYALDWVLIGLAVVTPIAVLFVLIIAVGNNLLMAAGEELQVTWMLASTWFTVIFPAISTFLGVYFFGRTAYGLPQIAVTGTRMGLRASWRQTRPVSRALLIAAVLAAGVALIAGMLFNLLLYGDTLPPYWEDISPSPTIVLGNTIYALGTALIGAAILTQVYRRASGDA